MTLVRGEHTRGNPDVATVPEAAILLGCSQSSVFRMANAGTLPGLVEKSGPDGQRRRWVSVPRLVAELHGFLNEDALAEARAQLTEARAAHRVELAEARARRSTETELVDG